LGIDHYVFFDEVGEHSILYPLGPRVLIEEVILVSNDISCHGWIADWLVGGFTYLHIHNRFIYAIIEYHIRDIGGNVM
jgi:hypothetical protein